MKNSQMLSDEGPYRFIKRLGGANPLKQFLAVVAGTLVAGGSMLSAGAGPLVTELPPSGPDGARGRICRWVPAAEVDCEDFDLPPYGRFFIAEFTSADGSDPFAGQDTDGDGDVDEDDIDTSGWGPPIPE